MPRTARLGTPGLLHHIMIRGIERRKIFKDDKDRENLIERLSILLPETKTQCYAWSFLSNHGGNLRPSRFSVDSLILKLERLKRAGFGDKNREEIQEMRRKEKGKPTTEDLRKQIPQAWREGFKSWILEGKLYSL